MNQVIVLWKWLLSLFKRDWSPLDYPLRYREQNLNTDIERVGKTTPRWNLQVINWWQMGGLGDTREEAFADFEARFASLRETGKLLPRPGRGLPPEFESTAIIERHQGLARDLLRQIFDLNYDECFISDLSSLYDFVGTEAEVGELATRIENYYQIEIPERENLLLSEILENIAVSRGAA